MLEAPISQAELEKALPKLANGKAAGQAGWLAELLRYSAHCVIWLRGLGDLLHWRLVARIEANDGPAVGILPPALQAQKERVRFHCLCGACRGPMAAYLVAPGCRLHAETG